MGSAIGIHPALGLSAIRTVALAVCMYIYANPRPMPQLAYAEVEGVISEEPPACC